MPEVIDFGVYVHFPFCRSKCPYCDFNSIPARTIDIEKVKKAYADSLRFYANRTTGRHVTSVFFGGGTPSLADADVIAFVLTEIRRLWDVVPSAEVSLEGNPDSLSASKMRALKEAGINRLSVGVQSLDDAELRFLGRLHSADDARTVLTDAKKIFSNLSADFIYTLPNQTLENWFSVLDEAIALQLPHLSLYQLTLEDGSTFERQKKVVLPDEETSALFYGETDARMRKAGYTHYEVSNFAVDDRHACRHNLIYWRGGDYIGVGAGACGRFFENGTFRATEIERNPKIWLENPTAGIEETVSIPERALEMAMMGLRLEKGIDRALFRNVLGNDPEAFMDKDFLRRYQSEGLLIVDDAGIRTTPAGRLILNQLLINLQA